MTLRFKSFIIAISFIVIISLFFSVSYYFVFLKYSRDVEARFAEDNIKRIYTSLNLEIKDFAYICSSYSDWVRTYNFIVNPNFDYITENLKESDFENFGFDFVAITDLKGDVIYADSRNYLLKLGLKSIIRNIVHHDKIKEAATNLEEISGIIKIKNEVYIISFNTVKKYQNAQDPNGYFIAGKNLKNANIFKVRYDPDYLNFFLFEEENLVSDLNKIRSEVLLHDLTVRQDKNSKGLQAYFLIRDVSEKPAILLTLYQKSNISDISQKAIIFIVYTSIAVIFILISIFILIFEKYVIKNLAKLNKNIEVFVSANKQINSSSKTSKKISTASDDEIKNLRKNVEKMLEVLNYLQSKERLLTQIIENFLKPDIKNFNTELFIEDVLKKIGSFLGADQVFIFISDKKTKTSSFKYYWNAAGIKGLLSESHNLSFEKFNVLSAILEKKDLFLISSLGELDHSQKEVQKLFLDLNVKSIMATSIFKNSEAEGILAISTLIEEKEWYKEDLKLLKNTAQIIYCALSLINRCK